MFEKLLAKRHISQLDLSSVREKAIEKMGWSQDHAGNIELEYRRFLYALTQKRRPEILSPPSKDVDDFWHQHILDTKKYRDDCQNIFGYYMDHTPGLTSEAQAKADAKRRQIYADHDIDSTSFDSGNSSSGEFSGDGDYSQHSHSSHSGEGHACDAAGHDGGSGHAGGDSTGGDAGCGDSGGGGDGSGSCGASCGGGSCGGGG